jgi:hypothetical protein
VREGIEIREPVTGGGPSPVTANGRRPTDVGAPDRRRRKSNPLLAPGPGEATERTAAPAEAGERGARRTAGTRPAADAPSGRRADPKRSPGGTRSRSERQEGPSPQEKEPSGRGVVCTVGMCPICAVVTAMGDVRPEITEHLLLAGRELLLAMKSLIDARVQPDGESSAGSGGLQRIMIE